MQPLSDHFTNVPAFLTKLWKMVSDNKTDHLICWSQNGNSFIILNQVKFWYELLPLYYKHNNMSSFVRQLNMYGFHKISSIENGPLSDGEKEEVQFYHPYFKKDSPELLKMIKRKVTVSKHSENGNQLTKTEDLSKVLADVKHLRGRQASVDNQLAAMKQENAVLWRELALLRQKHTKQQQIVNKLIQFLVSMVHPVNSRMGVGVKRHYPLMLRGTSQKKSKNSKSTTSNKQKNDGPTIHELDNELEGGNELQAEDFLTSADVPMIYSPSTPLSSTPTLGDVSPLSTIDLTNHLINEAETTAEEVTNGDNNSATNDAKASLWDKPSYIFIQDNGEVETSSNDLLTVPQMQQDPILDIFEDDVLNEPETSETKVFIEPSSEDALLNNFTNGGYNKKALVARKNLVQNNEGSSKNEEHAQKDIKQEMIIATRKPEPSPTINNGTDASFSGDLGMIVESNQSELDLYKDLLQGCSSLDSNALLGEVNRMPFYQPDYRLFSDGILDYGLSFSQDDFPQSSGDPMVSGQEIAILPLEELLDDSLNDADIGDDMLDDDLSQLNTPQISDIEPNFSIDKS